MLGKILMVEDDPSILMSLKFCLETEGFIVETASTGKEALENLSSDFDLMLLDLNLPDMHGFEVLKKVGKELPIICLTACDEEVTIVQGLDMGAYDYVTKPFNIQILLAKIGSLLRRTNMLEENSEKIDAEDFILNMSKSTIEKGEKIIELTKNEYKIIKYLLKNRGKIVSRDEIMRYLWDDESFIDDNTLTVNITRLRNKLEELNLKELLVTKRGQGYILL